MIQALIIRKAKQTTRRTNRKYWLSASGVVLIAGIILYLKRWQLLMAIVSICAYLLQADSPRLIRSLAGKLLGGYGRRFC
jgi:hypothetical protein